ncbi:nudix hydrolase 9-like [Hibiscus syriacus]|uniref:Exocyst subunit Exo70 family protein n=1 Tax=Hibiscus syriacus TaxID=106335 RepID=A0A6A2YMB7_HIBSY|nr:nudix hydrolase 9-like [Hibiscus syriacus]
MPRKGTSAIFSKSPSPTRMNPPPFPLHHTFSESLMEENIELAESVITKWEIDVASLFSDKEEARQYLVSIKGLQKAMQYLALHHPSSDKLGRAQILMQTTMKRLEREDENESIPEVKRVSLAAMVDLRDIAEAMISAGYAKECTKIYKTVRKSIVDEALYHVGVERGLSLQQIQKMEWEVLEVKIKAWLSAVKMAGICFTEISKGALALFGFPENVAKCKKMPEKMFRLLDLYEAVSDLWPEIESIFNFESTSTVRSTAVNSLIKLGDAVRTMFTDFETAILKDTTKTTVPCGGVHPLTRYVMNYISFLADYSGILSDIFADRPFTIPSALPESYFGSPDKEGSISTPISVRFAWLVIVMLCKLDGNAAMYKDVALSYLFLANNLQYVVGKVRQSNLNFLLGDDWVIKHEQKVKQYAAKYERIGWSKVFASLPENPTAEISKDQVKDHFRKLIPLSKKLY